MVNKTNDCWFPPGYSERGQSLLSVAKNSYYNNKDETSRQYPVLVYGNGPGYVKEQDKVNYTDDYFSKSRI